MRNLDFLTKNENFQGFPYLRWSLRATTQLHGPLRVAQEVVGCHRGRFPARTGALSGPEQPGNDLTSFHFLLKNQVFSGFPYLGLPARAFR